MSASAGKKVAPAREEDEERFREYDLPDEDHADRDRVQASNDIDRLSSLQFGSDAGGGGSGTQDGSQALYDSKVPLRLRFVDWSKRPEPSAGGPVQVRVECFFANWEVRPVDGKERLFVTVKFTLWWQDARFLAPGLEVSQGQDAGPGTTTAGAADEGEKTNPKADHPHGAENYSAQHSGAPAAAAAAAALENGDHWPHAETPKNLWRPEIFSLYVFDVLKVPENLSEIPVTFRTPNKFGLEDGELQWQISFEPLDMNMLRDANALRVFPFDSFRCDFGICLSGETRLESASQVQPTFRNFDKDGREYHIHWRTTRTNGEFYIDSISYAEAFHGSPLLQNQRYRDVIWSLHVKRDPSFYLHKGLFPLLGIVSFGFLGYFLDVGELADRLSLYGTLFLTCFAVQWLTMDRLPRVSYLTVFDNVVLGVGGALFNMSAGAGVAKAIHRRNVKGRSAPSGAGGSNTSNGSTATSSSSASGLNSASDDAADLFDMIFGLILAGVFVAWMVFTLGYKVHRDRKKYGMSRKIGFTNLFTILEAFEVNLNPNVGKQDWGTGYLKGTPKAAAEF